MQKKEELIDLQSIALITAFRISSLKINLGLYEREIKIFLLTSAQRFIDKLYDADKIHSAKNN